MWRWGGGLIRRSFLRGVVGSWLFVERELEAEQGLQLAEGTVGKRRKRYL